MKDEIRGRFHPVRDIEIEAYLCDELSGAARHAFEAELGRSRALRDYVAARERDRAGFLERHPFDLQLPAAERRSRDGSVIWGGLLAAVALLGLFVPAQLAREVEPVIEPSRDTVRVKGNTLTVELFVKRGEDVFRHRPGTALRPNDRVRISIESPAAGYLSVFGRDASGRISVYYEALPTNPGRYTVPDSLILDEAAGDEQWVLVHTRDRPPIERFLEAYVNGQAIGEPHAIVRLHKEVP
jgi:hypothetical protein